MHVCKTIQNQFHLTYTIRWINFHLNLLWTLCYSKIPVSALLYTEMCQEWLHPVKPILWKTSSHLQNILRIKILAVVPSVTSRKLGCRWVPPKWQKCLSQLALSHYKTAQFCDFVCSSADKSWHYKDLSFLLDVEFYED